MYQLNFGNEFSGIAMKPIRLRGNGPRLSNEDRDALIVKMRGEGASIRDIEVAARCNRRTVNKVLGREPVPAFVKQAEIVPAPVEGGDPVEGVGLPIHVLRPNQCRYPIAIWHGEHRFCGEVKKPSSSYCCTHHLVTTVRG
jgi:hypothetical protein